MSTETKKVELFSQTNSTKGEQCTLPVVGDVIFDKEKNSILIDEDKVEKLLSCQFGIVLLTAEQVKEVSQKKVEEKEEIKKQKIKEVEEKDKKKVEDMMVELSMIELEELLTPYPVEETKGLKTKSAIIEYLNSKLPK